ncbi:MAG: hypothetical protein ABI663_06895 [Chryseolinea sp.]
MKLSFTLFSCLVLFGSSCTEEIQPTPYNSTTIFSGANSKTWKMKFMEIAFNGEVVQTDIDACSTDDKFIFYANSEHTLEVTTGSKKCDSNPAEASTIVDSWSFNDATATLTMLYPPLATDGGLPFIVREVKGNKMELEIFLNQSNTVGYRIHFDAVDED